MKTVQIDSFFIRNYTLDDLGRRFSIVLIKNRFYLLFLPRVLEYWYSDAFYTHKAGYYELKQPEFAVGRVNSASFDEFVANEVFMEKGEGLSVDHALMLLEEIFPELMRKEADDAELIDWIQVQPTSNREVIEAVVSPILSRKPSFRYPHDWAAYKLDHLGYFLFDFNLKNDLAGGVVLDIYFLPFFHRYGMSYDIDKLKYKMCYP
ncbi:MAG TPA: hypothetical protein VK658_05730 [Chryseolinea sp.]|nr:hypothetical protein [Chryseolinea sp.]